MLSLTSDEQAEITALADLAAKTGARDLQIGYVRDDVPCQDAGWFAYTSYQGGRIMIDEQAGPVQAARGLAVRLLSGARCTGCGKLVKPDGVPAVAYIRPVMVDGSDFPHEKAMADGTCRYFRQGPAWLSACRT